MPIGSRPRLALLIDAENAPPWIAAEALRVAAALGDPVLRRAYGDFRALGAWGEALATHAIEPRQVFASATGKNAADIALVVEAMDLLHSARFDGFCIVSCDSDFTRLATRMRENGVRVHGIGHRAPPDALRAACGDFMVIDAPRVARAAAPHLVAAPARIKAPAPASPGRTLAEMIRLAMGDRPDALDGIPLGHFGNALHRHGYAAGMFGPGSLRSVVARCAEFEVTGAGPTLRVRLRRPPPRPRVVAAE